MTFLSNKSIFISGGTGSFGQALIAELIKNFPKIKRLVVFSRDELKQELMRKKFPETKYKQIRYFLGDIRDYQRLLRALDGIDLIVHAAALKQVPAAEYNPIEFIKTNVIGAQNIIEAAIEKKIKKTISLSSDKACSPINLYGATKLCSDKLFVAANNYANRYGNFSVVRYGNVMGSRGSVILKFIEDAKTRTLTLTDSEMTRFNISLTDSVKMVLFALKISYGGEIFVPKIASYKLLDLAKAIGPNCNFKFIGVRPGEKLHEEMISVSDSYNTFDIGKYYLILPSQKSKIINYYKKNYKIKKFENNLSYNSKNNNIFLSVRELRDLIKHNVDKNFYPV